MINFFYNKPLLRFIELLLFICLGATGYLYLSASYAKVGVQGLLDALAIYSFVIAGFLFILISEVADSYYLRALFSLITFVGMFIAFYFIFKLDAPHLDPSFMGVGLISFILAMAFALGFFIIVVGRLILEKVRTTLVARVVESKAKMKVSPAQAVVESKGQAQEVDVEAVVKQSSALAVTPEGVMLSCIAGPHLGEEFVLREGENQIGRTEGSIILASDAQVSRRHAVITLKEGKLYIRDLGSTNGTWVGSERISEAELKRGDIIMLGQCKFKIK